nr:hypothetical protein [Tautonia marina]
MPHQALYDSGGDPGLIGERGQLASQAMEVEHPARIVAVGDLSGLQINFQHIGPTARQGEGGGLGGDRGQIGSQVVGQVVRQG